jgi:hypothetical protein
MRRQLMLFTMFGCRVTKTNRVMLLGTETVVSAVDWWTMQSVDFLHGNLEPYFFFQPCSLLLGVVESTQMGVL